MSKRQGVGSRFLIQGAAHGGAALCSFAATWVIVRALGPIGFGEASIGLSVLTYALIISNFGADLHATQRTAHDPSTLAANLAAVMAIRVLVAIPLLLVIASLCLTRLWEPGTRVAVSLFSLSVIVNVAMPLWAAQALERAKVIAASTFATQALNLVFVLIAAFMDWGLPGFAIARVASDLLVAIGLSAWVRTWRGEARARASLSFVRLFLGESAPLALSQILRTVALGSDLLVLDLFVSPEQVGIYAVPYRIFMLMLSVSSIYTVVILPTFARRAAEGGEALRETLRRMTHAPLWLLVGMLGVTGAIAPRLLWIVFGSAFTAGSLSLRLLLIAVAVNFLNRCYRCVILASGQRVGDMQSTVVATVANLGAKIVLIPLLGPAGAAAGTIVGEAMQSLLQRRLAMKAIRAFPGGPAIVTTG